MDLFKDGMDRMEDWRLELDGDAMGQIQLNSGKEGPAVEVSYGLNQGQFIQISKRVELDLSQAKFIRLGFQGTGAGNNLQLKLVDLDGSTYGATLEGLLPTEGWTEVELPLANLQHFWGGDDKFNKEGLRKIFIAVTRADGGSGSLSVDTIQFSSTANPVGVSGQAPTLDMESSGGYTIGGESGTASTLNVVNGQSGQGLQIKYDFGTGTWLQLQKQVQWNIKDYNHLIFWYRSEGSVNNLQVKFVDADGSTFGATFEGVAPSGEWVEVKLPLTDINYFWGGDTEFNKSDIRKFFFAVTKSDGGAGSVELDSLRFENIILPQEQAAKALFKVKRTFQASSLNVQEVISRISRSISVSVPDGFTTSWGGLVRSLPFEEGTDGGGVESCDVTLENMILRLEVALEQEDKANVKSIVDLLLSDNHFFDAKSGHGIWLLDEKGQKKSPMAEKSILIAPISEALHFIAILDDVRVFLGDSFVDSWIKKLSVSVKAAIRDSFLLPLLVIDSDQVKPSQDRKTQISMHDLTALSILSRVTGDSIFDDVIKAITQLLEKNVRPNGLFADEIVFTEEGPVLSNDFARHEYFLYAQLKVALMMTEYAALTGSETFSGNGRRLLKFLQKKYVSDHRIVTSYDEITGTGRCNFESLSIYSMVVRLALREGKIPFAEALIQEKILPSLLHNVTVVEFFLDRSTGRAWCFDQLQVLLALLDYQDNASFILGDVTSLKQTVRARQYVKDRPLDVIDLEDVVDLDAISELGKTEGNFDGVGFSFGASSFGPSRSFMMCKNDDMAFVVPHKEGLVNNTVQCLGQEVKVHPDYYQRIHILTSAHHGNVTDFVKLIYDDGTSERVAFGAGDWWHVPKIGHVARECDLVQNGQKIRDRKVNLFHVEIPVDEGKALKAINLPANGKAVIFSMTAQRKEK